MVSQHLLKVLISAPQNEIMSRIASISNKDMNVNIDPLFIKYITAQDLLQNPIASHIHKFSEKSDDSSSFFLEMPVAFESPSQLSLLA